VQGSLTAPPRLWDAAKEGNYDVFNAVLPGLNVISAAPEAKEINIMERVGANKALVVFMRHAG